MSELDPNRNHLRRMRGISSISSIGAGLVLRSFVPTVPLWFLVPTAVCCGFLVASVLDRWIKRMR